MLSILISREITMIASHRKYWQLASWIVALVLGIGGGVAAMHKQYVDAEKDAELARLQVDEMSVHNQAIEALRADAQHGYCILDKNGRVREWNATMERWTGFTKDAMLGQNLRAIMNRHLGNEHEKSYAAVISDPKSIGKAFHIQCNLQPRAAGAPPMRVLVTARVVQLKNGERYAVAFVDREHSVMKLQAALDGK